MIIILFFLEFKNIKLKIYILLFISYKKIKLYKNKRLKLFSKLKFLSDLLLFLQTKYIFAKYYY